MLYWVCVWALDFPTVGFLMSFSSFFKCYPFLYHMSCHLKEHCIFLFPRLTDTQWLIQWPLEIRKTESFVCFKDHHQIINSSLSLFESLNVLCFETKFYDLSHSVLELRSSCFSLSFWNNRYTSAVPGSCISSVLERSTSFRSPQGISDTIPLFIYCFVWVIDFEFYTVFYFIWNMAHRPDQ